MYLNKAMIYGNLTRDPELKALPSGMNVCSFSLATNRVYNDRDGNRQEAVDYHNIVVFGKQADNCAKYLTKGSGTYVEGRNRKFTSAYFGWVRFTLEPAQLEELTEEVEGTSQLLRHLVIRLTKAEEANPFMFHEALDTPEVEAEDTDEEATDEDKEDAEYEKEEDKA